MAWSVRLTNRAEADLQEIDKKEARRILKFLHERLERYDDPRQLGKAMQGSQYRTHWLYRVGDYRIVAQMQKELLVVLVVQIGHRREVYDRLSF